MMSFSAILAEVEKRRSRIDDGRARLALAAGAILAMKEGAPMRSASRREAGAAYGAAGLRASEPRVLPPDAASLRREIDSAKASPRALRALRRRIARAAHPDRGGDDALMAEFNARIDAALRALEKR